MDVAHDVAVLAKMAEELQEYLLADVLYWQMQAPSNYPKLTLGLMLLTLARLEAADALLDQRQRAERNAAARQIDATLGSWQVAAEKKAAQELRSRLNLWQQFWDDCAEQPRTCADHYRQDVSQRVIASLLLHRFPGLAGTPEAKALEQLDRLARGRLTGDRFVWDAALEPGFTEAEFWYLYGEPRG
jgi:hypothetical protein